MSTSRRDFLTYSSVGILAAALEANAAAQAGQTQNLPPGAPPAFGTSAPVGPEVSPATFADAEKLVELAHADGAAAGEENWSSENRT
jgi:hypothetical protein